MCVCVCVCVTLDLSVGVSVCVCSGFRSPLQMHYVKTIALVPLYCLQVDLHIGLFVCVTLECFRFSLSMRGPSPQLEISVSRFMPFLRQLFVCLFCSGDFSAPQTWLAVRFVPERKYLELVRECYEAYVIYTFYRFICVRARVSLVGVAGRCVYDVPSNHCVCGTVRHREGLCSFMALPRTCPQTYSGLRAQTVDRFLGSRAHARCSDGSTN